MNTFKQAMYEHIAQLAQQLSSPKRLELIEYLAQAPRSVEALAHLSKLSVANTSRHLQQLKQAGLVKVSRQGKQRIYALTGDDIVQAIRCLRRSAEQHMAEMERTLQRYFSSQPELPAVDLETLKKWAETQKIILLDVRPPEEYAAGHIPGALNVPPENLDAFLEHFNPQAKRVIAYCRGPYCTFSHQAVAALRQRNIEALRLIEGLPEWRASGLPIETTSP